MTLLMRDQENIEKGIEQGIEKGIERLNKLTVFLAKENRIEDIVRAASDMEYQEKLFKEFGI